MIPPAQQEQIADDAGRQRRADEQHAARRAARRANPKTIQAEILRINTDAGDRSLQVALLVPILASLLGFLNSFRMMRLPDITPPTSTEGSTLA